MYFELNKACLNEPMFYMANKIIKRYEKYFYDFDKKYFYDFDRNNDLLTDHKRLEYEFVCGNGLAIREIKTIRLIGNRSLHHQAS